MRMNQTKSNYISALYSAAYNVAYAQSPEEAELYTYQLRDVLIEFNNLSGKNDEWWRASDAPALKVKP